MNMPNTLPNPTEAGAEESGQGLVKPLWERLVRYKWLSIAAILIGALVGTMLGHTRVAPRFTSTGLIQIDPVVWPILYASERSAVIPKFDSFVETQASIIRSKPVMDLARDHSAWADFEESERSRIWGEIRGSLQIERERDQQVIRMSAESSDPLGTQAGVQAVMDAYLTHFDQQEADRVSDKITQLEDYITQTSGQLDRRRVELHGLGEGTPADWQQDLDFSRMELIHVRQQIAGMINPGASNDGPSNGVAPAGGSSTLAFDDQISDLEARRMFNELTAAQGDLDRLSQNHGARHPSLTQLQGRIARIELRLSERLAQLASGDGRFGGNGMGDAESAGVDPVEFLHLRERDLQEYIAEVQDRIESAEQIVADVAALKHILGDASQRLEAMRLEATSSGRLGIVSNAHLPRLPFNHRDQVKATAMGGLMGAGIGMALVLLLSHMQHTMKLAVDADRFLPGLPVLGVLPEIRHGESTANSLGSLNVAMRVHEVRVTLENRSQPDRTSAIAVTGPTPNAGKTSLTLSLGLSFAATGARTLLIDMDLVGGGLTRQIDRASNADASLVPRYDGVVHSLRDGVIEGRTRATCFPNVDLLGNQSTSVSDLSAVSRANLSRILEAARERYDVILVDTGPIVASIEAGVACGIADDTVVVVSRGENRDVLDETMQRLANIKARIAGVVFNRAKASDAERNGSSMSMASTRLSNGADAMLARDAARGSVREEQNARLGPMANALADYMEIHRN